MSEGLTREQFEQALADATAGVLTVYREVDALMRELKAALADDKPAFVPFGSTVVPGVRKNPDARWLRNYVATFFKPTEDDAGDDEDEGDPDDDDGDDDDEEAPLKKKSLTIATGSGLLVARAGLYDRSSASFKPTLLVGGLTRCRVEPEEVPLGSLLKINRGRLRSLVRAINDHKCGAILRTNIPVQVEGQSKGKSKHRLVFTVPQPLADHRLFDIKPDSVEAIAHSMRATWKAQAGG